MDVAGKTVTCMEEEFKTQWFAIEVFLGQECEIKKAPFGAFVFEITFLF